MVRGFLVDEAGQRHEVDDQLTIGHSAEEDLMVNSPQVARRELEVRWTFAGRLQVVDMVGRRRTLLNGNAWAEPALLSPGDVLTVGDSRFTVAMEVDAPAHDDAVPLEVLEDVEDDARWEVWRDALLERGAALGERMAAQATSLPGAAACLSRGVREGVLRLQWRHGFVRAAQLCPQLDCVSVLAALPALLRHPFGALVVELRVDRLPEGLGAADLPALRTLSLGPVAPAVAARSQQLLGELKLPGAPRLARRTVHVMEHPRLKFSPAQERVVSGRVDLRHFQVVPGPPTGWRLVGWKVTSPALFHNGRSVWVADLFPGDEVRCGDVAFTFEGDVRRLDCPVPSS